MPSITTTLLSVKGECKKANLTLDEQGTLTIETIQKYLRKKEAPEIIGSVLDSANVLTFFGYKKGKSDTQNNTDLPASLNAPSLFGDQQAARSQSQIRDILTIKLNEVFSKLILHLDSNSNCIFP
jgi:hypothetical protein